MLEARKAGKIHYIGFTGHKDPLIHLGMLMVTAKNNFHFEVQPIEALHYSMTLPTSVVITGIDSLQLLDQALELLARSNR